MFFFLWQLVRCSAINFSRLTELIICPDESDWLEPLMLLLGKSPKLKKLSVDYVGIFLLF